MHMFRCNFCNLEQHTPFHGFHVCPCTTETIRTDRIHTVQNLGCELHRRTEPFIRIRDYLRQIDCNDCMELLCASIRVTCSWMFYCRPSMYGLLVENIDYEDTDMLADDLQVEFIYRTKYSEGDLNVLQFLFNIIEGDPGCYMFLHPSCTVPLSYLQSIIADYLRLGGTFNPECLCMMYCASSLLGRHNVAKWIKTLGTFDINIRLEVYEGMLYLGSDTKLDEIGATSLPTGITHIESEPALRRLCGSQCTG